MMKKEATVDRLKRWMMSRTHFSTADLMRWGIAQDPIYTRAKRDAQELAARGVLERLNWPQQVEMGIIKAHQEEVGAWRWVAA
jgi:hypothetical protein